MDKESLVIIRDWYYNNFGNWVDNPYPNWDEKTLLQRARNKEITIKNCPQKLNWDLVNNNKEYIKYKELFLELSSMPTKEEVAHAIHGRTKSLIDDDWDNELQNKNNPAGLINIESEITKNERIKIIKYVLSGICLVGTFVTIGFSIV